MTAEQQLECAGCPAEGSAICKVFEEQDDGERGISPDCARCGHRKDCHEPMVSDRPASMASGSNSVAGVPADTAVRSLPKEEAMTSKEELQPTGFGYRVRGQAMLFVDGKSRLATHEEIDMWKWIVWAVNEFAKRPAPETAPASNLVSRLRNEYPQEGDALPMSASLLMEEAADEIERLRAIARPGDAAAFEEYAAARGVPFETPEGCFVNRLLERIEEISQGIGSGSYSVNASMERESVGPYLDAVRDAIEELRADKAAEL